MTEDQVINIIRTSVEQQFPKDCNVCGFRFNSMKEYLLNTDHIGAPHSFDAELENWRPYSPIGTYSFSDCKCGNTMVLGSSNVEVETMCQLLDWVKKEGQRRDISIKTGCCGLPE